MQDKIFGTDFEPCLFSQQEGQHPCAGHRLGDNRRQRGALYAHIKSKDENRIQNNVGHRADQHGEHTRFCKALGCDKGVHAQRQLDEYSAYRINIHIADAVFNRIFTRAERHQEIPVPQKQGGRQYDRDRNLRRKAVAQRLLRRFRIPLSHEYGGARRAAVTGKGGESRDDHNQRHTYSYARQRGCAHTGYVADIDSVHNIVEHIDNLRGHCRKRQLQQ